MAVRRRSFAGPAGQHFLRSSRLATELVAEAEVARGDLIVEIGGGTGVLTQALAQTDATVLVVERDRALAARLRTRFGRCPSISVIEDDIAGYSWPEQPFAVVANLPFTGSGAVLARLLRDPRIPLRRADVIVQWEFAAKHAAVWPATLRSIHWRAWYEVSIGRRLSRTAFAPPPSVDAGVLQLRRRIRPRVAPELHEETGTSFRLPSARGSRFVEAFDRRSHRCRSSDLRPRLGSRPRLARRMSMPGSGRSSSPSPTENRA